MSKNKQILDSIKSENEEAKAIIDRVYSDTINGNVTPPESVDLKGSHFSLMRKIKRIAKKVGKKGSNKPSISESIRLLSIKETTKAVDMLTFLADNKNYKANYHLGKIYIDGAKNKVGVVEFCNPRKALLNLITARDGKILEAGYLLGLIYYKYGKIDEAKQVFFLNHRNGCMRSSTELVLILQEDLAQAKQGSREAGIINTYIQSIKTDISANQ